MWRGTADAETDPPPPLPSPAPRLLPLLRTRACLSTVPEFVTAALLEVCILFSLPWPGLAWLCQHIDTSGKKTRDALAWCHAMYTFTGIRLSPAMISCLHSMSTIPPTTHHPPSTTQQWRLMNPPKTACACGGLCGGAIYHTLSLLRAQELCESRGGRPGLPVPNKPYGLCERKAALKNRAQELCESRGGRPGLLCP